MKAIIASIICASMSLVASFQAIAELPGVSAGPVALGPAFEVAAAAPQGAVTGVAAAALPGNRFVVAWTDRSGTSQQTVRVMAVVLDAVGDAVAPPFVVSGEGGRWPVVAASPDGGFAIGWSQSDSFWGRTYRDDLQPLSAAFRIDNPADALTTRIGTFNDGRTYDLALTGNQLFATWVTDVDTVWRPFAPRTPASELRVIRMTTSGMPLMPQALSIEHPALTEMYTPNIAVGDGQFVVTWTVGGRLHVLMPPLPNTSVARATVRFQRFTFGMQKIGVERVAAYPLDESPTMSAAMNRGDQFVLAWRATVNTRFRLTSQSYEADGTARLLRQDIGVNEDGSISKTAPSVDLDESGAYAVVWDDPIGAPAVLLQLYQPVTGSDVIQAAGETLTVEAGVEPDVAMGDGGLLGAFWVELDDGYKSIRGRFFSY
jgi:hypothetical protein